MKLSTGAGAHPNAVEGRRAATRHRYLMCPPTYFDVVYSINPWMDPSRPVDPGLALRQWQRIHDVFVDLGHTVEVIPPVPGLPDMVFAANGATVVDGHAMVARFRYDERTTESAAYLDWFGARGYQVNQASWTNEGEGDFLLAGGWLLAGTGFRTDPRAHEESEAFLGRPVIGLTLVDDHYYHLDTALAVLDEHTIMYYPAAFAPESRQLLSALFPDAIIAAEADARSFGLNAVSDGRHVVLPTGADGLTAQLRERGYLPVEVEVSELLRAGGGVKCCTLELRPLPAAEPGPVPEANVPSAVVTSVASDAHNWNLLYLQLVLGEIGHKVLNLGPCAPDELLIAECVRVMPDLIVVSSVNGHGFIDGKRLISRIRACPELAATPVVIGGKLGIAGATGQECHDQLLAAGFDAVFEDGTGVAAFRSFTEQLMARAAA